MSTLFIASNTPSLNGKSLFCLSLALSAPPSSLHLSVFGRIRSEYSTNFTELLLTSFSAQRTQTDLFIVLRPICNDVRPSALPILSFTSLGTRLRWNIDVHIVFRIRELARILELKCRATQRRLEHYHGTRDSGQWFCCHDCRGMLHRRGMLL